MSLLSTHRVPDGKYAFHTTSPTNIESIRDHGLRRSNPENIDVDNIEFVLDELGYDDPFPFDRSQVIYCHVDPRYVESTLSIDLAPSDAIVVVDVEKIEAPMYLADMSIISVLSTIDLLDQRR